MNRSERHRDFKLATLLGDTACMALSAWFLVRLGPPFIAATVARRFALVVAPWSAFTVISSLWLLDTYSGERKTPRETAFSLLIACSMGIPVSLILSRYAHISPSPGIFPFLTVLQLVMLAAFRLFFTMSGSRRCRIERMLIVGGSQAAAVGERLEQLHDRAIQVIGTVKDPADFEGFLRSEAVDSVLIGGSVSSHDRDRITELCVQNEIQSYLLPSITDVALRAAEVDRLGDVPVFKMGGFRLSPVQRAVKRLIDLFLSLIAFVPFVALCPLITLINMFCNRGPLFFLQERVGLGGKEFMMVKFRTMVPDAEKDTGPVLASEDDARVTGFGAFLRASRLDELPQILNILAGDMSIVGPRPEREHFTRQFADEIPHYEQRLRLRPGLTGLAQVKGRYDTSANSKLQYDLMYIQNYSLLLDLKIIFQTIYVILTPERSQGTAKRAKASLPTFSRGVPGK